MRIADNVRRILATSVAARNSDRELLIAYMDLCNMGLSPMQKDKFRNMPSMETIRRTRQALQAKGLYLANPRIAKERHFKAMTIQQRVSTTKPDKIDDLIESLPVQQAISWLKD